MKSHYVGSLNCQRNAIYRRSPTGEVKLTAPDDFAGGEGDLCGPDTVDLVSLNNVPGLLEESSNPTKTVMQMSLFDGKAWMPPCTLTVRVAPAYAVIDEKCLGTICSFLRQLAPKLADADANDKSIAALTEKLSSQDRKKYERMKQLDGPLILSNNSQDKLLPNYMFQGSDAIFPIKAGKHLFLGRVGTEGFGEHYGLADLSAFYRLHDGQLEEAASFYLDALNSVITSKSVTAPR